MANACEALEIISKTEDKELACRFDSIKRRITETAFPEPKGTRVVMKNLFSNNEIRKARLKSYLENELSTCVDLIVFYGVIFHNIEFRFFTIDGKGKSKSVFSKAKFENEISNLCCIFGAGVGKTFHLFEAEEDGIRIKGYLSNPFQIETLVVMNDKIYLAINRRPIRKLSSLKKLLRSLVEQKTGSRNIFAILFIECPMSNVEVNIEKSKMSVRFKDETKIHELITRSVQKLLDELYSNSIKKMQAPIPNTTITFESQVITKQSQDSCDSGVQKESVVREETPQRLTPFEAIEGLKIQTLTKKNLSDLIVLGQFNKGFIICALKGDDEQLFVVDQHAADEKATYERLISQAQLSKQKLGNPIRVKLTSFEVLLAEKHIETFNQFGFELHCHPGEDYIDILTYPIYEDSQYGLEEFHELLNALKSSEPIEDFHFKKLETLFASNACRYSIMIGQVLTDDQMLTIIRNLATLKAPFNCPHGRPTLFQTNNTFSNQQHMNQISNYLFNTNA